MVKHEAMELELLWQKKNHKLSFLHIFTAIQNETENVKMYVFFVFKSDSVSFWHPENLRPWTCALAGRRRVPRARGRRRRQRTCRGPWGCPSSCPSHRCRRMDLPVETDCQTYNNCYLELTLVTCYCNLLYDFSWCQWMSSFRAASEITAQSAILLPFPPFCRIFRILLASFRRGLIVRIRWPIKPRRRFSWAWRRPDGLEMK